MAKVIARQTITQAPPKTANGIVPATDAPPAIIGSTASDAIGLGRYLDGERGVVGGKLRYGGALPVVVFGVNGSGKGTRLLMPNLLQSSGSSIVVVDPKGELAAVTAPHRRTLGRVVILNPFGVLIDIPGCEHLKSEGYNPLVSLDPQADDFNSQAALLAEAIVPITSKEQPYWDLSARTLISALIMFTVLEAHGLVEPWVIDNSRSTPPPFPSIERMRELLCQPSSEGNPHLGMPPTGLPALAEKMATCTNVALRNAAGQFADWEKDIKSVAKTAMQHTECFDDAPIRRDMQAGKFDFRDLKKTPVTVYLILPPTLMARHSKWLRLMLTAALTANLRVRKRGEPKVLFMLDEFYALGHLEIISTVWALVRGYGLQIMPVLQDLNQLKKLYPEIWETFIGMAGAVACFPPNDRTTAEWLSHRAGETTELSIGYSSNSSTSHGTGGMTTSNNSGFNYGVQKVPLVSAHKLRGWAQGSMLVTLNGLADMVPAYAPPYYDIRECEMRARPNPYYLN